ncbi:MAG: hypothetical protein SGBAC_012610 [Bacillariaceae sp.]
MVEGDVTKKQTSSSFPVYAEGSEMFMRGLVLEGSAPDDVVVTTSVESNNGPISWTTTASAVTNAETGQCFQSFAHSRIKELLSFRDAAQLLGDDMNPYSPLSEPCYLNLALCAENEALVLALESQLVWPGLTSIVTPEDETCQAFEDTAVCYDDGMGGSDGEDGTYGGYGSNENDNDY